MRRPWFGVGFLFAVAIPILFVGLKSQIAGRDPASRTFAAHIAAAKAKRCNVVWDGFTERTRSLMLASEVFAMRAQKASEEQAIQIFCAYSPASDLTQYLEESVGLVDGSDKRALVSAKYKYDRFFGFFGEGKAKEEFELHLEEGAWRVDHSEALDPRSGSNLDRHALALLNQLYTAERDVLAETGSFSADPAAIQAQLPGYRFGPISPGIAGSGSQENTLFVTLGPRVVCLSARSGSGTLVMIKAAAQPGKQHTFQYGARLPPTCDGKALERPYYGASARITK